MPVGQPSASLKKNLANASLFGVKHTCLSRTLPVL